MLRSETDRKTRDERLGQLVKYCMISGALDLNLYQEYDVKRGLRESDGKGVLTGLTEISDVVAFKTVHGEKVPCPGNEKVQLRRDYLPPFVRCFAESDTASGVY